MGSIHAGPENEASWISVHHIHVNNDFTHKLEKNHTVCSLSQSGDEFVKTAAAPLPRATSMAPVKRG